MPTKIEDRPIHPYRIAFLDQHLSDFLKIGIVPDIRQTPRAVVALNDTRHVYIEKWPRLGVAEKLYRVRDVLANAWQALDLLTARWKPPPSP
ncbi:hypothetical protein N9L71_01575 [Verrucomicrobiales bacterium]|nr:hypothetical protein [Verrucomicrobiales bacterium]